MIHGLLLSTSAGMGVNLERGRHVRMAELRLRHPQRSSLLVKQRPMCVPQAMPINRAEARCLGGGAQLGSCTEWRRVVSLTSP